MRRRTLRRTLGLLATTILLVLVAGSSVGAQSTDPGFPTPVLSNEIDGRIPPRDLGDARLTRHFYAFRGLEGDLIITVESTDLNGDVDLFTAVTLRPLAKVTLYAGSSPTKASKSVYLRKEEALVLRVEGRSAGDSDGVYRISFSGTFAPASGAEATPPPDVIAPTLPPTTRRDPNVRRATSVGARIEEPRVEAAEQPTPTEPKPEPSPSVAAAEPSTPADTTTTPPPAKSEPAKTEPSRPVRPPRVPRPRPSPRAARGGRAKATPPATKSSTPPAAPVESPAVTAPPPAAPSARLVIEMKDGSKLERDMSTVRRLTVENGRIVIVTKDGKTVRQSMTDVLRMSIEP